MPPALFPSELLWLAFSFITLFLNQASAVPAHDAWSRLWHPCPTGCDNSTTAEWAAYDGLGRLSACNQTSRLDFSLYSPPSIIRACSASSSTSLAKAAQTVISSERFAAQEVKVEIGWWDTASTSTPAGVRAAVEEVQAALLTSNNNKTTAFSYSGNSLAQTAIGRVLLQYCGANSTKGLGIVVDTSGDLAAVQRIMRDWNEAKCQSNFDGSKTVSASLRLERPFNQTSSTREHLSRRHSHHGAGHVHSLHRRATCETIQVASGDSCASLAKECGITGAKFEEYNFHLGRRPVSGDLCSAIAAANGLSIDDLEDFNKKTWGWTGCDPPMPASIETAVCGPQVPGTEQPNDGTALADLNPCLLKTCCNIWGQCAPGTAANGTNGCISNCGTNIVNNDTPPETIFTLPLRRSRRTTKLTSLQSSSNIDELLRMNSFPIFREGVTDASREKLATNVVNFIVDNDLEDIPGITGGDEGDGERYLQFLKLVREKLPDSKTLAIAAPASFWYLKGFPIAEISDVVDYIVYIAYDLHGQWDYGNQYATSGCPKGNCLRSHVNLTETTSALSMIPKAGVPSSKVIVGLSSYGRSFKMTEAGCTGPMCRFVGPDSGAAKDQYTDTAGYIADAEIYRILEEDDRVETYYDNSSDSNILVYGSTEWSFGWSSNDGNSNDGSLNQSIVYVSPASGLMARALHPCNVPPLRACSSRFPTRSTSVISRPPYVTTLDVAWPTTVTHILQRTTINAPAVIVTSLPMANLNITVPLEDNSIITIMPKPRFPAQTVTITNDPNPLGVTGVSLPPVTRSVTLPPWPQGTVIYYPADYLDNGEDDNNHDDDSDDDNNNDDGDNSDGDDDADFPPIPNFTLKDGLGKPACAENEDCGVLCSGPLDFCDCFICPGGGGAGDGGFADPNDPNPPPRPPGDPVNDNDQNSPESSCSETSTETNYWVSCESLAPTSTSCTTTSSMLAVGCDITAATTTTGKNVCNSFNPDEDQGDSNGRATPIPTVTATTTTEPSTTLTSTTSSPPEATAADGCTIVGDSGKNRCWKKCDPASGSPIGGGWAENDRWGYIQETGGDNYASYFKQSDCPTDFECWESWGCVVPKAGGCAAAGASNLGHTCWSSCDPETGERTNDEWNEGDPWC
ncbi:uncharacterized protein BDW70DRAFT_168842 [Aspergillus foveolatus]|uniref:uncharacterized protein n=1 Tax=Aspergillus foveolatus TaxID=210207 RepID=UPI003CCDA9EA